MTDWAGLSSRRRGACHLLIINNEPPLPCYATIHKRQDARLDLLATASFAAAKSYNVDGIVVAVDLLAPCWFPTGRFPLHARDDDALPRGDGGRSSSSLLSRHAHQFRHEVVDKTSIRRRADPRKAPAAPTCHRLPPPEKLAIGDARPEFELTDSHGRTVGSSDLRGKVVAVDLHLHALPPARRLPAPLGQFRRAAAPLPRAVGTDLVLLSVTVDPDYDTPAVLAEYAKRWGADAAAGGS